MSSDSSSQPRAAAPPLHELARDSVRYSEEDDAATQFVETPRPDPAWLVQVSLFDRRWMTKGQLLRELQQAQLVHAQTPVWQVGMRDWHAASRIEELRRALPALQQRRPGLPAVLADGRGLAGAALFFALLAVALACAALLQQQ